MHMVEPSDELHLSADLVDILDKRLLILLALAVYKECVECLGKQIRG